MNESFLSYLWKYRHLNREILTESGDPLTILHPGEQNSDSGPDFFNARVRIGSTTWAGNVEIHVQASDWFKHGHHLDLAYDHAILHVVYEADQKVYHQNGEPMQTLVMKDQFPPWILDRYQQMMQNHQWIPCMNQLHPGEEYGFTMWAPALTVERLEQKTLFLRQILKGYASDWEEACYRHLAGSFGFKINGLPFELLAKSLPLKIVRQHCDNPFQMEAILFGQSGMLDHEFSDLYSWELRQEYHFLRAKYNLEPIPGNMWKFLRLRPCNFPTLRISQFAGFLCRTRGRFFNLFEEHSLDGVMGLLKLSASDYWTNHYVFDKPTASLHKATGSSCINLLIINGIVPFLFFYGREKGQHSICTRAVNFLEQVKGEDNATIKQWKKAGFPTENAMQTQALLQLKMVYCDKKRCLECRVGSRLLGNC
jgi:Protein of unknown function (DUF2851)